MAKSTILTTPNIAGDVEQQELSHSLLEGMQNGAATLEENLIVSSKTEHTLAIGSSNHILWNLPERAENLYPQKNLHRD